MARKRLLIRGLVVGVSYRATACDEAVRLGLRGWVRNRRDARVEALVEGDDAAVAAFVAWCRHGPPAAHVAAVEVSDDATDEALATFTIKPTGS